LNQNLTDSGIPIRFDPSTPRSSFAQTQAATDGDRGARLVYYFDLLDLGGSDVSSLQLVERKALLEPLIANKPGLQFNGHETGDGELILKHAGKLGFEGVVSKTIDAPYAPGNRGLKGPPHRQCRASERPRNASGAYSMGVHNLQGPSQNGPGLSLPQRVIATVQRY
jgi:hypothetical protein